MRILQEFFIKKNRNLRLHFNSFHGYGNLDKAIKLLEKNEREDFANLIDSDFPIPEEAPVIRITLVI